MERMLELLETNPVIAAVKSQEGLNRALESQCSVIFLLFGSVCDITDLVDQVKGAGKAAIVHMDLVQGLASKEISVDFLRNNTRADGIISTKSPLVKHARELGLLCIQRSFVVDSMALATLKKQLQSFQPDAVEIMPGIMPQILRQLRENGDLPLIAGGLIQSRKDIIAALDAGADAISTTREALWNA